MSSPASPQERAASRKQKHKKKQKAKPTESTSVGSDSGVLPSVLPTQPISWSEVSRNFSSKKKRWSRVWDWSKPKYLPLNWCLPIEDGEALTEWAKGLSIAWSDQLVSSKQWQKIEKLLEYWTVHAPLRMERLGNTQDGSKSDSPKSYDQSRDARLLGLEAIAAAWLLPALPASFSSELIEECLGVLLGICEWRQIPGNCPIVAGLWQCELPLTLSAWLPNEVFPASLKTEAVELLQTQIEALTDGNGLVVYDRVSDFAGLLAGWTRLWRLEKFVPDLRGLAPLRDRYRFAFQQYLRLLGYDGAPLLCGPNRQVVPSAMVATWLMLGQDAEERRIAELTCGNSPELEAVSGARLKDSRLSDAADYSAWGHVAVLRNRWKRKSDKLAIAFGEPAIQIELNCKRSWLAGVMNTKLTFDGETLELGPQWEEICWQSDDDMIYLELQNELADDRGLLQRQFAIARKDHLCLIADAVLLEPKNNKAAAPLKHQWTLPLAEGVQFAPAEETREGWLTSGNERLSILPISMPEWRVQYAHGRVEASESTISMDYELPATRVYQAVLIDLDSRRSLKPISWSPLTVGENLQRVSIDQAMAVRVQLNREQFLLYRSLTAPASRTFVGQNVYADFYWGRLQKDGMAESLIMIEST
ncbi:MAG: hypothetical protein JNL67_17445 [Planctomycetaceae bacterium]|nr:hypothetical protein [Planctomycetaceae bacterium]